MLQRWQKAYFDTLMFAEFIDRPISGQFPEKHFGRFTPYSSWVKFTDNDYREWVGSFTRGWEGHATLIINFEIDDKALVAAGGQGYLIDIAERQQLNTDELSEIKSAIADPEGQRVIFSSGYGLQTVDLNGLRFTLFDKYYFDDIELTEIRNNKLYARYWYYQRDNEPYRFEIDLETKEVKDTYFDTVSKTYTNENPNPTLFQKISNWFKS